MNEYLETTQDNDPNSYQDKVWGKEKKAAKHKQARKTPKPPKKITSKYLYNSGLAYLQRFPASTAHFKSVMGRKIDKSCRHHEDQSKEDCLLLLDETALKFQQLGLLDDAAYLKGMVTSYRRRGLPARQIEMRLSQKGLNKEAIQKELRQFDLEEFHTDNGEAEAALIFIRKKRLGAFDKMGRKDMDKSLATMARSGYSYAIAKKILELSFEEIEIEFPHLSIPMF
jgi:regulatory protein